MKNIFRIFFSDIKAICSNFFALVVVLAVLVIPALYAWVNIYANWDPYGNTGNVPIALANGDLGYTLESGEYVNKGQEIVEEISASTSINWVVLPSVDAAIAAVERGDYYGALVMGENLSRNMYNLTAALDDDEPAIIFYQNAKTNAIANKITTTASTTAENNIQTKYLSVLIEKVFTEAEELLSGVDAEEKLDDLIRLLGGLRDTLRDYSYTITTLGIMDSSLPDRLEGAKDVSGPRGAVANGYARLAAAEAMIESARADIDERAVAIQDVLYGMTQLIDALDPWQISMDSLEQLIDRANDIESRLQSLRAALPSGSSAPGIDVTARTLDALLYRVHSVQDELQMLKESGLAGEALGGLSGAIRESLVAMEDIITQNLVPGFDLLFDGLERDVQIMYTVLNSVDTAVGDIPVLIDAAQGAVRALQSTMKQLCGFLDSGADALDLLVKRLEAARDNDSLSDLIDLLGGDPEEFAAFLSKPVQVSTTTIYPVENYGSAMTPFYSTLAIWVGCVVNGAIIKPEPKPTKLRRVRESQLFWGRFLIFFLLSQIQAAIIVAGDIHLLGAQCIHPKYFYLVGAVTSFTFTCLIYSLILAFGDVGKAIVVVIMVVQIAGSSGSYPIELLPDIFSKIYLFFPFPYAINAMRETLCGMYRYDLFKFLAELLVFAVLGLLIGLKVQRHFKGINEFIEEEMEKSGVL